MSNVHNQGELLASEYNIQKTFGIRISYSLEKGLSKPVVPQFKTTVCSSCV